MPNGILTGNKLLLMVNDPWDFSTEIGCGPFDVEVIKIGICVILLRLKKPFVYQNVEWCILAASPRNKDNDMALILSSEKLHVNVIRVDDGQVESDPETFGWSTYRGKYSMLTGSLQKS